MNEIIRIYSRERKNIFPIGSRRKYNGFGGFLMLPCGPQPEAKDDPTSRRHPGGFLAFALETAQNACCERSFSENIIIVASCRIIAATWQWLPAASHFGLIKRVIHISMIPNCCLSKSIEKQQISSNVERVRSQWNYRSRVCYKKTEIHGVWFGGFIWRYDSRCLCFCPL